jgi:hypothetical protein
MENYILIVGTLLLIGIITVGILVWKNSNKKNISSEEKDLIRENEKLRTNIEQNISKIAVLKTELENIKKEKHEQEGKSKQVWAQKTKLEEQLQNSREILKDKEKRLVKFEESEERRRKELENQNKNLENARKALEEERIRIQREDEEIQQKILEEKNRIWNDHENNVVSSLRNICQKPELAFAFFDNTNLPAEFAGNFKPDGLVEFMGQYILFDAKFSNQKKPNTYFQDQVKKTVEKIKKQENKIYQMVFLVVPENRLSEIKQTSFSEGGFSFFIIAEKALEPILFAFKRISEYENLKDFTPEDREQIINIFAEYDRHISFQNAANILLAKKSINLMNEKKNLPSDFQSEVENKKKNISDLKLKPSEIKNIAQNVENQEDEIKNLVSAKPIIDKEEIEQVNNSLKL